MKKSLITIYMVATMLVTITLIAETSQQTEPPKGNGSHSKDTSFISVKDTLGHSNMSDTDTVPPSHKRKTRFQLYPTPNNTNGTNGSPVAPGQ